MQKDCRVLPKSRVQTILYMIDGKKYPYFKAIAYLVWKQGLSNREAAQYLKSLPDWKDNESHS